MIEFSRGTCGNLAVSENLEWLVTNGIGGFASGTVAGLLTRSYHGLLIAAFRPPSGRTYLVSKLNETVTYADKQYPINSDRWTGGVINPIGYLHIEQFALHGTTPVWTYAFGDALLEKRIWMKQNANTTFVQYKLVRGTAPLTLTAVPLVNYRSMHNVTQANNWEMAVDEVPGGIKVTAYTGATPFYLTCDKAAITTDHNWHRRFFLMREANRGHNPTEDHLNIGQFELVLQPGESTTFTLSTDMMFKVDGEAEFQKQQAHEHRLINMAASLLNESRCDDNIRQLILAADQFIVRRPLPTDPDGYTIMSGYHWLNSHTRDTIRALTGLMLVTGRAEKAGKLLRKYAFRINQGLLPDRFDSNQSESKYDTADATLLYIEAIRAFYENTQNINFVRELYPALQDIILWLNQGTHHNIHADPADGLLQAGDGKVSLTWMDDSLDGKPVTPRAGKPVEINALWYNALCTIAHFADVLGENPARYTKMAKKVKAGFGRFWNDELGYCYDVLDTENGNDSSIRPNAVYAVALHYSPLSPDQQKSVVDICARHLLTSHGLRTLAVDDRAFIGQFGGDSRQRNMAHHQGTVWASLMGLFTRAHLRVYKDRALANSFIAPLCQQTKAHGLGTIGEVFDGAPPFTPQGCIAYAWSVAELLHAYQAILQQNED
ncbi:MAG: glycogen debranching enzyme family protein [Anaerolineales bacterium]|nr:glycogen debranching enzyme family protein [Anaerolineales bacterium]